jgi:hypothetical protein
MKLIKSPAAAAAYCDLTPLPFPAVVISDKFSFLVSNHCDPLILSLGLTLKSVDKGEE